jgi:MinD-like ATPase involved in chromosome partitioning or flagellar assembly
MKVYLVQPSSEPQNNEANNDFLQPVAPPRPLVIVVAEPEVHALLAADADFDVHADAYPSYEGFLAAARARQVPLERSPVVVVCSDALLVAGGVELPALVSMVRDVAVVITWTGSEHNGVIELRGEVTRNALRHAIGARIGARFAPVADGDIALASPILAVAPTAPPAVEAAAEPEPIADEYIDAFFTAVERNEVIGMVAEPVAEPAAELVGAMEDHGAPHADLPPIDLPPAPPFTPDAPLPAPTAPTAPPRGPLAPPRPLARPAAAKPVVRDDAPAAAAEGQDFWNRFEHTLEAANNDADDFSDFAAALADTSDDIAANWQPRTFRGVDLPEEFTGQHEAINPDARPFDLAPSEAELNGDLFAPAAERDRLPVHQAQILAVYSPKGGVGKTSISVNLASRLAMRTNLQVCIVDLDLGFGNVGTRLGLFMPTVRELLAEGRIDNESVSRNLAYDPRTGVHALLAPLRPEVRADSKLMNVDHFEQILKVLADRFDVIILDCPVELTDPIVARLAIKRAHRIAMVLNNEQATLIDARRAIESMTRPADATRLPGMGVDPSQLGIIVNQKVDGVGRDDIGVHSLLSGDDASHPAHGVPIIASIPDDRVTWVRNANLGRPVATDGMSEIDTALDCALASLLPGAAELLGVPNMVTVPGIDDVWADAGTPASAKRFALRKRS